MLYHAFPRHRSITRIANATLYLARSKRIRSHSPFEKGQSWAIQRKSRLPMATWIMASDTSSRVS
jgi:hypothetical protein